MDEKTPEQTPKPKRKAKSFSAADKKKFAAMAKQLNDGAGKVGARPAWIRCYKDGVNDMLALLNGND